MNILQKILTWIYFILMLPLTIYSKVIITIINNLLLIPAIIYMSPLLILAIIQGLINDKKVTIFTIKQIIKELKNHV